MRIEFSKTELEALLHYLAHSENLDAQVLWDKIAEALNTEEN
jgi:hypothetical protein